MKVFLFSIFVFCSFCSISNVIEIKGTASAYPSEKIEVVSYVDLINKIEIRKENALIDKSGLFTLSIDLDHTQYISLKIRDFKASFYVKPGSSYKINIDSFDLTSAPPLSRNKLLTFEFIEQDQDSLNYRILEVNQILSKFQQDFFTNYMNNSIKQKIPELENRLEIQKEESNYVNNYKKYILARQQLLAKYTHKEVFDKYLNGNYKPQNAAYAELFLEFYSKWFNNYISNYEVQKLNNSIANLELDSLKNLLQQNDFLQESKVLELILANELYRESTLTKRFKRKNLIALIDSLKNDTENKNVQITCAEYINKATKLSLGSIAPDFQLENQKEYESSDNRFLGPSSFKGKYVYIGFWTKNCKTCLKAMVILNSMYEQYSDSIEFVSINLDKTPETSKQIIETQQYKWTFLNGSGNIKIRDDYDVAGLPLYYLLDTSGRIIQSPAEAPGEGIELLFNYLFDTQRDRGMEIWDWNKPMKNQK